MAQYIQNARALTLIESFDEMYNFYKEYRFIRMKINCNKEFKSALDIWHMKQELMIKANYANSQDHVPRAERNNHTIQERVRAACYQLPFHHLPCILVKYLVVDATKRLNYFPAQHGVSKYYSPRMILHIENLE